MTHHSIDILIVEHEPERAEAIRRALLNADKPMEIRVASSLKDFRKSIEEKPPELVLVDLQMPDGSAESILTSPPETGLFPIVVMDRQGDESIAVSTLRKGAMDYLVMSPDTYVKIPQIIEKTLRSWKSLQESRQAQEALAVREEIFSNIVSQAVDAIALFDIATERFVEFNTVAHEGLGYTREEFASLTIADFQAEHSHEVIRQNVESAIKWGHVSFETRHRHRDGRLQDVWVRCRRLNIKNRDYMTVVWTDITERKRTERLAAREAKRTEFLLELHQKSAQLSDIELYNHILESAVQLTESSIGFFHQISDDQKSIRLITWNKEALKNCKTAYDAHYPLDLAGNWVDCIHKKMPVVYNDYPNSPNQRGLPPGHTPLHRFLSFPLIRDGKVRIIFGVGNKTTDYTEDDVNQLHVMANEAYIIMQKRESIERLQRSEDRFRQLVETSSDLIWETDEKDRYTFVSPTVLDILGYSPENIIGASLMDFLPSQESRGVKDIAKDLIHSKQPFRSIEHRVIHKNGFHVFLESSGTPMFDSNGRFLGYRGVARDISERKKAEAALAEREEIYSSIVNQATDGIILVDMESGRIVECNPSSYEHLGYTRHEFETKRIWELDEDMTEKDFIAYNDKIRELGGLEFDTRQKCRDGSLRDARVSIRHIRLQEKDYASAIWADVSIRKRAEERLLKVSELQSALHVPATLPQKLKQITDAVVDIFDAEFARIWLTRPGDLCESGCPHASVHCERCLHLLASSGRYTDIDHSSRKRVPFDCFEIGRIASGKIASFLTNDATHDSRVHHHAWARDLGLVSFAGYQIKPKTGETIGVMALFSKHALGSEEDALLQNLSHLIVPVIESAKIEESLRQSEVNLNRAQSVARIGSWHFDLIQNRLRWSTETYRIFGVPMGTPVSYDLFLSRIHPDDRPAVNSAWQAAVNGQPYDIEHRIIVGNDIKWVREQAELEFDSQGLLRTGFGTAQDISERKRYEESLFMEKERYHSILNTAMNGFCLLDGDCRFLEVNDTYCRLSGYSKEELENITFFDVETLETFDTLVRRAKQMMEKGRSRYETRHRHKSGRLVDVEVSISYHPLLGNGQFVVFITDITERRAADEEKKNLEAQLNQAQKIEVMGTLAGGIAHDFNNILFPIIGFTEMLLDTAIDGSESKQCLQHILSASLRASDLVQQILAFSRGSEIERAPVEMGLIIRDCVKLMRATIPSFITIQSDIEKPCGMVLASPTHIHQIMMNLMTNAYHSMEEHGGTLTVSLSDEMIASNENENMTIYPGRYVRFSVADTGCGIDEKIMDRIFDPYFTTKAVGKGTGLGLAVVHGIVKNYGGGIRVSSETGHGTVFDVYLPVIDTKELEKKSSDNQRLQIPGGNEHILIVDDEDSILRMAKQMLERSGYKATTVSNSIEAHDFLKKTPEEFDMVITDMNMPGMTGDILAAEIKKIRPDIPVILCTGYSSKIIPGTTEIQGVDCLLIKPIVKRELLASVRSLLDRINPDKHEI